MSISRIRRDCASFGSCCPNGLHIVLLVQSPTCYLDVLSFVGYNYDIVEQNLKEKVEREHCKECLESGVSFDDSPSKIEAFHLHFEIFVFLSHTLYICLLPSVE